MSAHRDLPAVVLAAIGLAVGAAGAVALLFLLPNDGTNQLSRLVLGYVVWVAIAVGILVLGNRALRRRRRVDADKADRPADDRPGEPEAPDR